MAHVRFVSWRFTLALASLLPGATAAQQIEVQSLPGVPPAEWGAALTPITGNRDMLQPGTGQSNLDAGDLVTGSTWWRFEGIFWIETYLGFLWAPGQATQVFAVPASIYFDDNFQFPAEVSDNQVVVGTNTFFNSLQGLAFRWSSEDGFQYLPLGGLAASSASSISADGTVIGGAVRQGLFAEPRAARWVSEALDVLGPPGESSYVRDTSDSGVVLVGEHGPTTATAQATRWVGGVEVGLDPVPGATTSVAWFASDDGTVAVGQAAVGGKDLLVRWLVDGSAAVHTPPKGLSIQEVAAINPDATAIVGALTDQVPFQANQVPFLWREGKGFRLIGELGLPDEYDRSRALDVSDDGKKVVGQLTSSVISNGFPPSIAFLWTGATGTQDLEQLLSASGEPARGLYHASAISGDGRRILATGVVRPTPQDTTSVLLEFELGPPLK